jgi:hypothetical protein
MFFPTPRRTLLLTALVLAENAADFMVRRVLESEWEERLTSMVDKDIVEGVLAEKGNTHQGRAMKAAVLMLERHLGCG